MRIFLIGGTSHAGKSTLAANLSKHLGWRCLSTDSLARHPGRPWRDAPDFLPPHVIEHYRELAPDALMQSVLQHYGSMWEGLILPLVNGETGLIMEGSALLPDNVKPLLSNEVQAVWLVAGDDVIERRIQAESHHALRDAEGQFLIDRFTERALIFNRFIADEVARLGLPRVDIDHDSDGVSVSSQLFDLLRERS